MTGDKGGTTVIPVGGVDPYDVVVGRGILLDELTERRRVHDEHLRDARAESFGQFVEQDAAADDHVVRVDPADRDHGGAAVSSHRRSSAANPRSRPRLH